MAKKSFEESLERIEEITRELEEGDIGLEASLKRFEEGIKLIDFCNQRLDEAQKKIQILTRKGDQLVRTPQDPDDEDPDIS